MKTLARPALRSAATSISTMAGVRIRALTERHPIKPTSPRCHSAWQLNLGRHSTYRRGKSVQTTGTTSSLPRTQQLLKAIIGLRINLQALPTRWVVAMGIALLLLGGVGTLLVTREGEAPTSRLDVDEDQKPASASPPQVQFNPPQGARQGEPPRQAPRLPSETAEPRGNEELRNAARDSPPARPSEQPSAPVVSSPT